MTTAETDQARDPDQARTYADIKYRLLLVNLALGFIFLGMFQWSGASNALAAAWARVTPAPALQLLGYLAVFGPAYYLVTLPVHVYGSFTLEHRFGLSRQNVGGWLAREMKRVAVSAVISLAMLEGLYALFRELPDAWPLWATAGWVALNVLLARIFPTVLLPLFYKTTPLQQHDLVTRLLDLCQRAGLPALGVFRFDLGAETRKANAALAGLGKTRRVLLADTLLASFTPEEIEGVLAHELAHHRFHHITLFLVTGAAAAWIAFRLTAAVSQAWIVPLGLTGLDDPAGLPVFLLWLSALGLVSLPVQNGISRRCERQADRYAVAMTRPPLAFAAALRRLAALNLADPHPPRWIAWMFYDHPPIVERIRDAERPAAQP